LLLQKWMSNKGQGSHILLSWFVQILQGETHHRREGIHIICFKIWIRYYYSFLAKKRDNHTTYRR
jgi:hypothetical protein